MTDEKKTEKQPVTKNPAELKEDELDQAQGGSKFVADGGSTDYPPRAPGIGKSGKIPTTT